MCLFHQLFSNVRHDLDFGFPVLWRVWKAGLMVETVIPSTEFPMLESIFLFFFGKETFHSVLSTPLMNLYCLYN